MSDVKVSRALVSVFDKAGLKELVGCLDKYHVDIISSGGTAKAIQTLGYKCTEVSTYTGYPESPDGLVKTLQPKIHGGLLLDVNNPSHKEYMDRQGIPPFDLAAVNLYPFGAAAAKPGATSEQVFEMIDIGGPAMVRAAGKGALLHGRPCVVVDPADYKTIISEMDRTQGQISGETVNQLAFKAFEHTAGYDAAIDEYLCRKFGKVGEAEVPTGMRIAMRYPGGRRIADFSWNPLRNGENPHLKGLEGEPLNMTSYKGVIEGRGMSLTNHLDLVGYATVMEISKTMEFLNDSRTEAVVINKHTNPAVYAAREKQLDALTVALTTDRKSPFGGVMATSSKLRKETAEYLAKKNKEEKFVLDVLTAPGFEEGSIDILADRMKNLRMVDVSNLDTWDKVHAGMFGYNMKWTIGGKPVATEIDRTAFFNADYGWELLSEREPTKNEMTDAHLAWIGAKAIQSNSFAFVKDGLLLAQCGGQTNREDSAKVAKMRADEFEVPLDGGTGATDSFIFDNMAIELLYGMGIKNVVHPTRKMLTTGSLEADEPIAKKVDEYGMSMLRFHLQDKEGKYKPWRVFRHVSP